MMKGRLNLAIGTLAAAATALTLGASVWAARQPAAPAAPREITVVAKRFAFEPARIEVTEGEAVRLLVTSADGVHGVQIRKVRVNKLIPRGGKPIAIDFVAPDAGTYPIVCSEECGDGHTDMTGSLVVVARKR